MKKILIVGLAGGGSPGTTKQAISESDESKDGI